MAANVATRAHAAGHGARVTACGVPAIGGVIPGHVARTQIRESGGRRQLILRCVRRLTPVAARVLWENRRMTEGALWPSSSIS